MNQIHSDLIIDTCYASPVAFINDYVSIYDSKTRDWIPFKLWGFQAYTLKVMHEQNLVSVLKARQLGMSWVALAYILWAMIFRPGTSTLIASRREEESKYLLSDERLRGMWEHLSPMFTDGVNVVSDSKLKFALSNGSVARAIPSNRGDSYTGQIVFADEFDLVKDQEKLLLAVKPVISAGGKLLLVSKSDKTQPMSTFKSIYKAGKSPKSPWTSLFFPWNARPDRDQEWYQEQVQDSMDRTRTMDAVYENFPATDEEALAPYEEDKRFNIGLLNRSSLISVPILNSIVFVDKLIVYREPDADSRYVLGIDPAEGNPTSDFSVVSVMDKVTGEEMALYKERVEIDEFVSVIEQVSLAYRNAPALIERNNHGHAVILGLRHRGSVKILSGPDNKFGFNTNAKSKALLYAELAEVLKDELVTIVSEDVHAELSMLLGSTLSAPKGLHDDCALAFALANFARRRKRKKTKRRAHTRSYSSGGII